MFLLHVDYLIQMYHAFMLTAKCSCKRLEVEKPTCGEMCSDVMLSMTGT